VQDAKGADWESTSFILLFGSFGCPVPWSRREHSSRAALTTGYIGEFEIIDDHRGGKIVIQLNGRLNKTGVISPRFNVGVDASRLLQPRIEEQFATQTVVVTAPHRQTPSPPPAGISSGHDETPGRDKFAVAILQVVLTIVSPLHPTKTFAPNNSLRLST